MRGDGEARDNYRSVQEMVHHVNSDPHFMNPSFYGNERQNLYFKVTGFVERVIYDD